MAEYYLAVDIGASSGRHMLAYMEEGKIRMEEIHRFPNGLLERDGELCWDVDRLFREILSGMKKCARMGKIPRSMGIDTWAVDYVLVDRDGNRIGNPVSYRDGRTRGMEEKVYGRIGEEALYARTGIQRQPFNTVYQLTAVKQRRPEELGEAEAFLMIPDYFHFLLTGRAVSEYTNATTTQLVSPGTRNWDRELIRLLGFPAGMFREILAPGTWVGGLRREIAEEVGYDCRVILPATHDTASAVMAVPSREEDMLYISSGTWSLIGTQIPEADCRAVSRERNFTNEGGYGGGFRYLKNIMGLWMIQCVRREIGREYSFEEIAKMAAREKAVSLVDCNDGRFLAPESMVEEVRRACVESGNQPPDGLAQTAAVIYNSLAASYAVAVSELCELRKKRYDCIHIVGGGANVEELNRLTAQTCGMEVLAGPTEATAVGNIAVQMIAEGELPNLKEARTCISRSFPIRRYHG